MLESLNVALAHDALINTGGAERVAAVFAEVFPEAPIFTAAYHPEHTFPIFSRREVRTTGLQRLPHRERLIKCALPLGITGIESFDFRGYDIVLSSSTFLVKGVITPPETWHVSYLHNVFRLLWMKGAYASGAGKRGLLDSLLPPLRLWDLTASQRPDFILTNSRVTRERIRNYYRRDSTLLPPPVDLSAFHLSPSRDDYFLVVSRLEPYKRVDIAIGAFNRLGRRLVVVGEGSMRRELEKRAGRRTEILGTVTDELLCELYCNSQALVFPGEEDFGLVPLEAQASGRPVIAYGAGGVLETVTEETGVFFSPQTEDALITAVRDFEERIFEPERIRAHALGFDKRHFIERLMRVLERHFPTASGEEAAPSPVHAPA
jgi:glycosyltransferase involved in cell wall biosynthesis